MSFKTFLSGIKRKRPVRQVVSLFEKAEAGRLIARLRKAPSEDRPVRVGFIAQMPEVWNKNAPVFERMFRDERFDAKLIVVPSFDFVGWKLNEYGAELEFFSGRYPKDRILTSKQLGGNFEKLKDFGFDYIVYQRCWEQYLPKTLHTKTVLRFAKTVYIPYCFDLTHEPAHYYKTPFFRYACLIFAPSKAQCERMKKCGVKRTVFEGYPTLDPPEVSKPGKAGRPVTVLWTPRWTEADFYGGTSFYDYKEEFLRFRARHPEFRVIFRPHPLLYENAVREKKMTETEMTDLLNRYRDAGIVIDANADVNDTLAETDVLWTDFSSIIMNAFLCGIPILYLKKLPATPLYEPFTSVAETLYYPSAFDEAEELSMKILGGEDPKKAGRDDLLGTVLSENRNSAERIVEHLLSDYKKER